MRRLIRYLFSKAFWIYLLFFSLFFLLLLGILGGYLYNYYYNTIYDDFTSSNSDYTENAAHQYENNIKTINNIAVQIGLTESLMPFQLEMHGIRGMDVKKQLKIYEIVSSFLDQIYLIYDIDEYLYNSMTSVSVDRFLNAGFVLDCTSPEVMRGVLRSSDVTVLPEQNLSGNLCVEEMPVIIHAIPIQPRKNGTLLFVTNGGYYDELLACEPEDMRTSILLWEGTVIASRGLLPLEQTQVDQMLHLEKGGNGNINSQFQYTLDEASYLVTVKARDNGFTYCTIQAMEVFYRKIGSDQWEILIFLAIFSVIGIFLIVLLSRWLYKPVNTLLSMFRKDDKRKRQDSDFSILHNGIAELVESKQELTSWKEESLPVRQAEVIHRFVRGIYPDRETFLSAADMVNLSLDYNYFAVALISSADQTDNPVARHLQALLQGEVTGYSCELVSNNQALFVFFGNDKELIKSFVEHFANTGKALSDSFIMAVSGIHKDYSEISSAYLEANTAFDHRFLLGQSDLLRFEDVNYAGCLAPLPTGYIESLKNALRCGDSKKLNDTINDIFNYLRDTNRSLFAFRVLYNDIISIILRNANFEQMDISRLYDVFTMSHCMSIQDLDATLRDICTSLMSHDGENNEMHERMREAAAYMQENYEDSQLNMSFLADIFSINTVTLSREFKKAMGMNPSDYLTLMRMERAKQLLQETDLSIKEICSAIGYYSIPSFTQRFKHYTAATPAQFRQEHAKRKGIEH